MSNFNKLSLKKKSTNILISDFKRREDTNDLRSSIDSFQESSLDAANGV